MTEERCTSTKTDSWIQEAGLWRRVRLPKYEELEHQQFQNGDYSAALGTAEKWLLLDPFSLDAYHAQIFALSRGGRGARNTRALADIVRAVLAVNPADSSGLFTAVSFTKDTGVAEIIFDRFPLDDCSRENAAFNLADGLPPRQRLAFLNKIGSKNPMMQMSLIAATTVLGDTKRLGTVLTEDVDKQIRTHLNGHDGGYAANWSVAMAEAWLLLKKRELAKGWAAYAAIRDPNLPKVAAFLRRMKN